MHHTFEKWHTGCKCCYEFYDSNDVERHFGKEATKGCRQFPERPSIADILEHDYVAFGILVDRMYESNANLFRNMRTAIDMITGKFDFSKP